MPIRFDGGVDEANDATDLAPGAMAAGVGEYRVGSQGFWSARGRSSHCSVSGVTWASLYAAGFDNETDHILALADETVYAGRVAAGMSMVTLASAGDDPGPLLGTHFANRHYVVTGATNMVVEPEGLGLSTRRMGMIATTAGVSTIPGGSGNMSATIGLEYWATEYDSVHGIESVAGATINSGAIVLVAGVTVVIGGLSANSNADTWRIYRSSDGGVFPTGGLLAEVAIGATTYFDADIATGEALLPAYGSIDIGGLDFDRDVIAPVLRAVALFDGSLVGLATDQPHSIRFTPANFPESWPTIYEIPLQTERHDFGQGFAGLNGQMGVFTRDTVHRLTRLPREIDAAYAPAETLSLVTPDRGAISQRGIAVFTLPGRGPLIAFASRDGIWATNLAPNVQLPLTDAVAWDDRVDATALGDSVLVNNIKARRLEFYYRRLADTTHNTGVMYLDYQAESVRVTHPDHGPLADGVLAPLDGILRVWSADSRAANGSIYTEQTKDTDDSHLVNAAGAIVGLVRTADLFPAGPLENRTIGAASWMHGAGPSNAAHRAYVDLGATGALRAADLSARGVLDIGITKMVNSLSLELSWATVTPFVVQWLEVEGFDSAPLRGEAA